MHADAQMYTHTQMFNYLSEALSPRQLTIADKAFCHRAGLIFLKARHKLNAMTRGGQNVSWNGKNH